MLSFYAVEIICDEPHFSEDLNVSYSMDGKTYMSTMNLTCAKGYRALNGSSQLLCNESGMWEGDIPMCIGTL